MKLYVDSNFESSTGNNKNISYLQNQYVKRKCYQFIGWVFFLYTNTLTVDSQLSVR